MICLTVYLLIKAGREQETADMFRSYVRLVQAGQHLRFRAVLRQQPQHVLERVGRRIFEAGWFHRRDPRCWP